jgi:hypothetical protein
MTDRLLTSRVQWFTTEPDIDAEIDALEANAEIEKHLAVLRSPNTQRAYDEARRAIEILMRK